MLRFTTVALVLAFFVGAQLSVVTPAAQAQDATPAACAASDPAANESVALEWYTAINDRDLTRFDALMTENTAYGSATVADTRGPAGVRDLYQQLLDGFSDFVYTPQVVVSADEFVAVEYAVKADHTGTFRGLEATGNHLDWHGISIMRFECGRIAETWVEVQHVSWAVMIGSAKDIPAVRALAQGGMPVAPMEKNPAPACEPATPAEANLLYYLWDEMWDTGNVGILDGYLTDAAAKVILPDLGPEAAAFHAAIPDMRIDNTVIFSNGDYVVGRWTDRGTMTGEFYGVPPTGEAIAYSGNTILRIECGKIAEEWTDYDNAGVLDQMKADWRN